MKISVVVPAFNEEKLLRDSLRSIKAAWHACSSRGWETELIVCDNNSTDRTAEIAREEGAIVCFEPINQIGRARNRGASAATGDWLVFVDADSYPSPELLGQVATVVESGAVIGGGCTVEMGASRFWARCLNDGWNLVSRTLKLAAGSFIFCEAKAFREIGGFSNDLFVAEEIELSRKLKRLARARGQKFVILHRHPLLTSARKVELYSTAEMFGFMVRASLLPWRTMKDRAACQPWYDGRR